MDKRCGGCRACSGHKKSYDVCSACLGIGREKAHSKAGYARCRIAGATGFIPYAAMVEDADTFRRHHDIHCASPDIGPAADPAKIIR